VLGAVLFDLDGTLLDIDLDAFFREYFSALGPVIAEALDTGMDQRAGLDAVLQGTEAMSVPHPGRTNQEVFNERFREFTGADLDLAEYALPFERFYAEVFPTLRGAMGPRAGARRAVLAARDLGLPIVIATNPIFPRAAIEERIRWAGLEDVPFSLVTTYEVMHATKPLAGYYLEVAEKIGVDANRCLMVGDDRMLDMPASDVGMRTFYVGRPPVPSATWHGALEDLAELLPRLIRQD